MLTRSPRRRPTKLRPWLLTAIAAAPGLVLLAPVERVAVERVGIESVGARAAWADTVPSTAATTPSSAPAPPAPAAAAAPPVVTWAGRDPADSPPPLSGAVAAYDPTAYNGGPGVVLFGGATGNNLSGNNLSGDTWTWDGRTWTRVSTGGPSPRQRAALAFDPALHQLVLFGGQGPDGALLADTWAWNGYSWSQISVPGAAPPARYGAGFSYDPAGDLLLYGGTGYGGTGADPTPNPDNTTSTAQAASSSTTAPAATTQVALSDAWQWTGTAWQPAATGPPALSGASMVYDSTEHTTVLFGGQSAPGGSATATLSSATWTWNGSQWTAATPTTAPPPRSGAVAADAPALGGIVVAAGTGTSGVLADTWVWSAGNWVQATVMGTEAPRAAAADAFDTAQSAVVVFGGNDLHGGALRSTDLVIVGAAVSPSGSTTTTTSPGPSTVPTTKPAAATTTDDESAPTSSTTTAPDNKNDSVVPSVAAGDSVPTTAPNLQTSSSHVPRGGAVRLSGAGFRPGAVVTIMFHSQASLVAQVTADSQGSISTWVSVPDSAAVGQHHFVATGEDPSGQPTQLVGVVFVFAPQHAAPSVETKAIMVLIAVLAPIATWFSMDVYRWLRRRRVAPNP